MVNLYDDDGSLKIDKKYIDKKLKYKYKDPVGTGR